MPLFETRNNLVGDVRRGGRHGALGRGGDGPTGLEHTAQRDGDRQTSHDHQSCRADRLSRNVAHHVKQTCARGPPGTTIENIQHHHLEKSGGKAATSDDGGQDPYRARHSLT
eukprot:2945505-Pyramimonas_sp.AAC.1